MNVVAAATEVADVAGAAAERSEQARCLEPEVVQAMRDADLFRLCVPQGLGGAEAPPRDLFEAVEAIARQDASAAWILAVTATSGLLAAYLEESAAAHVFGPPGVAVGGVFAPRGRAVGADGTLEVTGRWSFASGSTFCDWLLGGCVTEIDRGAPELRLVLFPRADVRLHDTWTVSGLRATGSHDIEVSALSVPAARSATVIGAGPRVQAPLYAFPMFGLLAVAIAAVALGAARAALEDLGDLAGVKKPEGSSRRLAERPATQAGMARAEASLRASRALLTNELDRAFAAAETGGEIVTEVRMSLRLAATHAVRSAKDVVDAAYEMGGGSSVYADSPLQRRFRDVHVATQHMLVAPATWELTGRLLLELPTDTSQL